ncbi:hypothetical protein [Mycoplasma sp. Ms02]|uniref:hypothetical protein n=1 Tax=Mycoplasma sp. Ms02 TaxID=353851 RepID=UPI001C89D0FF|nr:hypothetical protein [Mycoplasma sp. Ms02]QZE12496.1 hypothetical protein K4L35_00690 [Mycoplasma sp. Ms02]
MNQTWDLLIHVYNYQPEQLSSLSQTELEQLLAQEQGKLIRKKKNPNGFWIIRGLPEPKEIEQTTSAKWGYIIVFAFFAALILGGVAIMLIGLVRNGVI